MSVDDQKQAKAIFYSLVYSEIWCPLYGETIMVIYDQEKEDGISYRSYCNCWFY
jgi:hypothetical protein